MTEITAQSIDAALRKQLDAINTSVESRETGTVVQIGDGIARIDGLKGAMSGELLEFVASDGRIVSGLVQNLEEDEVGAVLLGDVTAIKENDQVRTTGKILEVPVGKAMLGRVVNVLGQPIDGKGPIETTATRPVEFKAPGVHERQPVEEPMQTGILAVDSMIPIGRGQRELIIGDRQCGKTAVAIDTAREPEPERRPPAEPEPEPGPGLEPDARCVDDAGSEDRANPAVDPWEIGPLPSASNPVGNDIPADAPASEPQHVGGAVEPADLADTIDLTPVGDRDAAMPVREWRRIATTAGGILLAACVTVAGMSAWRSHESATAARELEQATADCATAHAAAKKAEQKLVEYLDGDRLAQAKAVTADKLADPETLETLDKLAEQYSEGERIPACAATDTETANATTSKLQAIEKKHTGNLSRLKKAAGAVFSSRLAHTVEQGERLYSSSEGKVQDEYSRALLRASIDKRDEKAITDAMDKVNASIDAKTKADEERKAQEEAAAAAAAQAQSTPAPQQYSYTPSGSASGPGSGPSGGGYHSSGGSAGSTGGSASPGWSVPANPDPSQLPGTDPSL